MSEMRELTTTELDAVSGGWFGFTDIDVIASHNGNGVFGQNAASAGNGIVVLSSVSVVQSASK